MRHPRTTAEVKAENSALDNGVKVRAKRNYRNIPNEWDDMNHARRGRNDRHKNHRRYLSCTN